MKNLKRKKEKKSTNIKWHSFLHCFNVLNCFMFACHLSPKLLLLCLDPTISLFSFLPSHPWPYSFIHPIRLASFQPPNPLFYFFFFHWKPYRANYLFLKFKCFLSPIALLYFILTCVFKENCIMLFFYYLYICDDNDGDYTFKF